MEKTVVERLTEEETAEFGTPEMGPVTFQPWVFMSAATPMLSEMAKQAVMLEQTVEQYEQLSHESIPQVVEGLREAALHQRKAARWLLSSIIHPVQKEK